MAEGMEGMRPQKPCAWLMPQSLKLSLPKAQNQLREAEDQNRAGGKC
jgi:hypothetical protein